MRKLAVLLTLFIVNFAYGMIDIYVDGGVVGGADDGTSPEDAYDTLFEAEAENLDLVTATDDCTIHCKGQDQGLVGVTFAGWTTSADYQLYVETATTDRHDTTRASGYYLAVSDDWMGGIRVQVSYITFNGLAVSNNNANANHGFDVEAAYTTIVNCLLYDNDDCGIHVDENLTDTHIINNIAYGNGSHGFEVGHAENESYIANCTAINNGGAGISNQDFKYLYAYNCYCANNTGGDFVEGGSSVSNFYYCMAADTSFADNAFNTESNCTDSIALSTSAGSYLTNVTATSENCNIGNDSSSLIDAGTDADGNAWWPTACESAGDGLDYAGTTRSATWDIGADERIVAAEAPSGQVIFIMN